ncbi:sigma-70 family RNA polymerase sigma factor [Neorhizobium lilium]|nr:sigma-70 family RNA polymerase sigma factor [Neorhizobium lilium]
MTSFRPERMSHFNAVEKGVEAQIPALRRFARRLVGSSEDVDDLVQETLTRALNAAPQFQPGTALKSWLFTIMRNTFCTSYRVRQREHVGMEDGMIAKLSVAPPQDWAVRRNEMQSALERLPPRVREPLVLIAMGTSYDETARICNCEVGTVKSRVNRARKALSEELGDISMQ